MPNTVFVSCTSVAATEGSRLVSGLSSLLGRVFGCCGGCALVGVVWGWTFVVGAVVCATGCGEGGACCSASNIPVVVVVFVLVVVVVVVVMGLANFALGCSTFILFDNVSMSLNKRCIVAGLAS